MSRRPMNAPPADAFINYRPTAPQASVARNNSGGASMVGSQPPLSSSNQPQPGQPGTPSTGSGSSKPPPLTLEQSRAVARTHYSALKGWLAKEGALAAGSTRTNAREKLTRLTRQQFQELSTDVYDELMRRIEDASGRPGEQPFLPVRSDFHPKRNQARQKLATLPLLRFRDLASDVYYELDRRYPEFAEEDDNADGKPYSPPAAGTPTTSQFNGVSSPSQQSQQLPHSRTGSLASQNTPNGMASPPLPSNLNARRAPTPQQQSSHTPQHSSSYTQHSQNQSHGSSPSFASSGNSNPQHAGVPAGNDVVVPNKSTMMVEEPAPSPSNFRAGSGSDSGGMASPMSETGGPSAEDRRGSGTSANGGMNFGSGGRSLLASPPLGGRQDDVDERREEEEEQLADQQQRPNPAFAAAGRGVSGQGQGGGHMSRASETSSIGTRFFGGYAGSAAASEAGGGRRSYDYEAATAQAVEKVKSEYEYKLTMLQNRVGELERENDDAAQALKSRSGEQDRTREVEREMREMRERFDSQADQLRSLQREHDSLRASSSSRAFGASSPSSASGTDSHLRTRLHESEELANELRGEVSALVDEVRQANERCEELQMEVERERESKEKAEKEAGEWKSRWQQAKLELRNIKATSQLFSSSISVDADYMPASSDGLIKDTSVADFQTSIDDLLQAARSKEPSSVLPAARAVVAACEKLDNDIQAISPSRFASLTVSDQDLVNSLKVKVNATLSNLMTASKNHAMSFGVSPVSLLDAAASHLAATIVELVRILKIRRSAGGSGGSRNSLDPSAAFGRGGGGGGFHHEPMPPLPELSQPQPLHVPQGPREPSPDVGPAPPSKEKEEQKKEQQQQQQEQQQQQQEQQQQQQEQQQQQQQQQEKQRSPGYLSGGMSSLLGGAGSMTKALEAMGISSGKRSSIDSVEEKQNQQTPPARKASLPQGNSQQQQQQTERESLAFSDMSLDSSARASPIPPQPVGGVQYQQPQPQQQQRGYDSYDQQQHYSSSYPQYGQQQQSMTRDTSASSLAYRSNTASPAFGQAQHQQHGQYDQQQRDDRSSPYSHHEQPQSYGHGQQQHEIGQRNGGPAFEYGSEYQAQGEEQYGHQGQANGMGGSQYGSPSLSRSERNPEELRTYIENQTEAIVHSIQSLLSAIRSGAQGSELTDNLTQIITIVSSIVAISQEALPPHARSEGDAILDDLTTHCDKLSEMQNGRPGEEFNKQTKQAMAAASFGVAKSLKQLNSLLHGQEADGLV
ncbi:hypothetical protein JCM8547_001069 [Rhodosporidiobolus lusitaniae]